MKTIKFAFFGIMLFAAIAAAGDMNPSEMTEVIDNDGYSWGSIPPIESVSQINCNPILSPDGEWIVFLGSRSRKLWLVPSEGGTPVEIYDIEEETMQAGAVSQTIDWPSLQFTPDGSEISFTIRINNPDLGSFDVDTDPFSSSPRNILYSIRTFNLTTYECNEIIKNGQHYDWSADGRYISYINVDPRAYYDPDNAEHHYAPAIYDTQTGETRYLTDENYNQNMLLQNNIYVPYIGTTFSPDGTHIVTSKYYDGARQLAKIPFDGGEPEQITFVTETVICEHPFCVLPTYSPDGEWILFNIEWSMVVMNAQSGVIYDISRREPFTLTGEPIETPQFKIIDSLNFNWSADGTKIIYNIVDGTYNYYVAIYDFEPQLFEKITSVEETQPEGFAITGNYPNPFNPTTTIDFTLSEAGDVSLAVFNVNGQKMRELVSGSLTAGRHSIVWDGRDQNGKSVSSGVYITRLMMRDKVTTSQMMLLK